MTTLSKRRSDWTRQGTVKMDPVGHLLRSTEDRKVLAMIPGYFMYLLFSYLCPLGTSVSFS